MLFDKRKQLLFFLVICYSFHFAKAELTEIKFSKSLQPLQSRYLFDSNRTKVNLLEQVRMHQWKKEYPQCLDVLAKARVKYKVILPWLSLSELECGSKLEGKKADADRLKQIIQRIEAQKDWFLLGPYSESLRQSLVDAKFIHLSWQAKFYPQEAWKLAEDLLNYFEWMTLEQKADAFKYAGEFAFVRQRLSAAKRFIERSLELREDEKLRNKLNSIDAVLKTSGVQDIESKKTELTQGKDERLEASEKENEITERMKVALRSGDIVAAIEDGMRLMEDYPFGSRAQWASERIFESYSNIITKNDQNYLLLKERMIKQMLKADGKRLNEWANQAFKLGQYKDAYELGYQAQKKIGTNLSTTALLFTTARAAAFSGDEREARKLFTELTVKHAGTEESRWALFYRALIEFRLQEYTMSTASLERLLVLPSSDSLDLEIRYWLWRSLQKVDSKRAELEAKTLIQLYPFTYYGLRAQAEMNSGFVELENLKSDSKLEAKLWVTKKEKESWDRIQVLTEGGWWKEAQTELESFPHPKDPVVQSFLARYWAAAFHYPKAIRIYTQAWDKDVRLRENPFFQNAFPREFDKFIEREAKKNGLDANLVRSLIRQESAFNFLAKSRSGALGLMQMIPPTADEVARDLKVKGLSLPNDLFDPEKNLIFCTYYLAKLLKQFNQNVPAALAAYNAGPTRIQRWLDSRRVELSGTSEPEKEIWIDELPWSETRFYVKAILRNLILYRAIDAFESRGAKTIDQNLGRVFLRTPIWVPESVDSKQ